MKLSERRGEYDFGQFGLIPKRKLPDISDGGVGREDDRRQNVKTGRIIGEGVGGNADNGIIAGRGQKMSGGDIRPPSPQTEIRP